jgi:plastocyanin
MKYISYIGMAISSTMLVILLSLSSCNHSTPKATTPIDTPKVAVNQPLKQSNANTAPNAIVKIANFKYQPADLKLNVGETVQFVNKDEEPHTVTAKNGAFDSKALDTDQTWTSTFTTPGTFPYVCSIHPFMQGTITVTPKRNTP